MASSHVTPLPKKVTLFKFFQKQDSAKVAASEATPNSNDCTPLSSSQSSKNSENNKGNENMKNIPSNKSVGFADSPECSSNRAISGVVTPMLGVETPTTKKFPVKASKSAKSAKTAKISKGTKENKDNKENKTFTGAKGSSPSQSLGRPPLASVSRRNKETTHSAVLQDLFANASDGLSSGDEIVEIMEEEKKVDVEKSEENEGEENEGVKNDDENVITEGVAISPIPTVTHEIVDMSEDSPEDSEEHSAEHSSVLSTPIVPKLVPKDSKVTAKVTAKRVRPSRAKGAVAAAKKAKMSVDAISVTPCAKGENENENEKDGEKEREGGEGQGGEVEGSTVESMECEGDDVVIIEAATEMFVVAECSVEAVVECATSVDTEAIIIDEGVAEMEVSATTEPTPPTPATTTTTAAAKRKRKPTPAAAATAAAAAKVNEKAVIDLESEVLSPEVSMKLQCHQDRMRVAVGELVALERLPDVCDLNMNIEGSIRSLMRYRDDDDAGIVKDAGKDVKDTATAFATAVTNAVTAVDGSAETSVVTDVVAGVEAVAEVSEESISEAIQSRIAILIALSVQGSSLPLTLLVPVVQGNIIMAIERLTAKNNTHNTQPSSESSVEKQVEESDSSSPTATTATVDTDSMETDTTPTPTPTPSTPTPTPNTPTPTSDNLVSPPSIHDLEFRSTVLDLLTPLLDPIILREKIKSLALREPYGPRGKTALLFEDSVPSSVWRWEILSNTHFSKQSLAIRATAKETRRRYGRYLKAIMKVSDQLLISAKNAKKLSGIKSSSSDSGIASSSDVIEANKIAALKELVSKALVEVEKAKERRRESDRRQAAAAEEKLKKEAQKEILRLKKEENYALEKLEKKEKMDKEKENQKKVPTEKEIKAAQQQQQQRSMFSGFFKSDAKTSSATATATTTSSTSFSSLSSSSKFSSRGALGGPFLSTPQSKDPVICLDGVTNLDPGSEILPRLITGICDPGFDLAAFETELWSKVSMGEISRRLIQRYKSGRRHPRSVPKGPPRPKKTLSVTVSVAGNAFAAGPDVYSELKEVSVDSKMRVFSFHEDYRPPYKGTFSKSSRVLNGRRPFEKDHTVFNYDFDSEGEWEEGDGEGEDIGESDDEEDGEGDELEYDDFLRQDTDFGSDADSDGEVASAAAIQRREGIETLGPRFLTSHWTGGGDRSPVSCAVKLDSEFSPTLCSEREKDVVRLRAYTAVVYAQPAMMPYLGGESPTVGSSSHPNAVTVKAVKADFDESLLYDLAKHIHGSKEGMDKLLGSFQTAHPAMAKAQIRRRIIEIADKERHSLGYGSQRWVVKSEVRVKAGMELPEAEGMFTPKKSKKHVALVNVSGTPITSSLNATPIVPSLTSLAGTIHSVSAPSTSSSSSSSTSATKAKVTFATPTPTPTPTPATTTTATAVKNQSTSATITATVTPAGTSTATTKTTVSDKMTATAAAPVAAVDNVTDDDDIPDYVRAMIDSMDVVMTSSPSSSSSSSPSSSSSSSSSSGKKRNVAGAPKVPKGEKSNNKNNTYTNNNTNSNSNNNNNISNGNSSSAKQSTTVTSTSSTTTTTTSSTSAKQALSLFRFFSKQPTPSTPISADPEPTLESGVELSGVGSDVQSTPHGKENEKKKNEGNEKGNEGSEGNVKGSEKENEGNEKGSVREVEREVEIVLLDDDSCI